ncbi:MAG: FkbM family methyltransferase [Planctomycetaceae bacterium]
MKMSERSRLLSAWSNLEERQLRNVPASERASKWGELRQAFYKENGAIPLDDGDVERLRSLHNKFVGSRIFVIGNGPSLNRTPLHLLADEFTFATNRFYLMMDKIAWRPSFYTATDWRVVPDIIDEISLLSGMVFFFEERFRGLLSDCNRRSHTYWYTHGGAVPGDDPRFAFDITKGVRGAGSVTGTAIQLAYYMGFDPIILIGCDQNYRVPTTVVQEGEDAFGTGVKLLLTSTADDDPNHFDPSYFGRGRKWHDPNMPRMVQGFEQCREAIEESGREIINATVGGHLESFRRVDFNSLFPRPLSKRGRKNPSAFDLLFGDSSDDSLRNWTVIDARDKVDESGSLGEFGRDDRAHLDEMAAIATLFSDGQGILVDVGAHRGSSLIHFAKKHWTVFAFEPDEENMALLTKTIQSGYNVIVDTRAVGQRSGQKVSFYTSPQSSGISSLHPFTSTHQVANEVETVTLDQAVKEYGLRQINVLKIDTEGNEMFVLEGFGFEPKPQVIVVEYEDAKTIPLGYSVGNLARLLCERGYHLFVSEWHPIERYGVRHSWRRLYEWGRFQVPSDSWGNLIALDESVPHGLVQAFARQLAFPERKEGQPNSPPELAKGSLEAASSSLPTDVTVHGKTAAKHRYRQTITQIREASEKAVPRDATVLVVSKGDDQLLNLNGRRACHFPQTNEGAYAGHHPSDSAAAIDHLESLRKKGASFLLVPETAFWWFDHYREFKRHLDTHFERVPTPECCIIYCLAGLNAEGEVDVARVGN